MAFLSKQLCEHCGKTANAISRTKLADGKYICFDCSKKCSRFLSFNFLSKMTYKDFIEYLQQREYNRKRLEYFNITDVYFDKIYVDMEKGWMVFDYDSNFNDKKTMLEINPDIFEMKNLVFYNFYTKIKDVKQGVFSNTVKADVKLVIAFNNRWYPYSFSEKVFRNYKYKAEAEGLINRTLHITEDEKKEDLELYLLSALIDNGVGMPVNIGGKFTANYDFSPYDTYLKKMFELDKLCALSVEEMDEILHRITPSSILRRKLKSTYKNKARRV